MRWLQEGQDMGASKKWAISCQPPALSPSANERQKLIQAVDIPSARTYKGQGTSPLLTVNRSRGLRPEAIERETRLPSYEAGKGREGMQEIS